MARASDADVLAEARSRVAEAQGGDGSTLSKQREDALKYYRGDPLGTEVDGRSQVVSRDVAQYIDSQMPALLRIFTSGDEVARFEPRKPGDEEKSAQATDYVNWIWSQDNAGFVNFHHWFKDALLNKLGTVKIWWEEEEEITSEKYERLDADQLEAIRSDGDVEVEVTAETEIPPPPMPPGLPPGMPVPEPVVIYDATVTRKNLIGRVRVEPVPPEEMRIGARTRNDVDTDVLAHVTRRTRSSLIAAGYSRKLVDKLPQDGNPLHGEENSRFEDVDDNRGVGAESAAETEVEWCEAYFRFDRNDDGQSEMLRVCYSGSELLDVEEVDDHPFAFVSPILMPHRLVGMSTADQTMDLQLVKTTIQRQILDNLYLTNMPQIGAVDGQVNLDDLLTRRPGGVVRLKARRASSPYRPHRWGKSLTPCWRCWTASVSSARGSRATIRGSMLTA